MATVRRRGDRSRTGAWPAPRGLDLARLRAAARFGYGGAVVGAAGVYLIGPDGEKYLDAAGGAAVPLGHGHAAIASAVRDAKDGPGGGSPLLADWRRLGLVARAATLAPDGLATLGVFADGEAALEAGLALARSVTRRTAVAVVGDGAGEGDPLGPERLDRALEGAAAVVVEPLPSGSFAPPAEGALRALRGAAEQRGALVVADERSLGVGRCGALLASGTLGLEPDLLVVGGLGGGLVPSALLLGTARLLAAAEAGAADLAASPFHSPAAADGWASPFACALATATLEVLAEEEWPARAGKAGEMFGEALRALEVDAPEAIADVRGAGLAWGIECAGPEVAEELVRSLAVDRILVLGPPPGGRVVRLIPPLVVERRELDFVASSIERALEDL